MVGGEERFSGRGFRPKEIALIRDIVQDCSGLSRMELARTVCELLRRRRPNGSLKARECREFLERLEGRGELELPGKRPGRAVGSVTRVPQTDAGEPAASSSARCGTSSRCRSSGCASARSGCSSESWSSTAFTRQ